VKSRTPPRFWWRYDGLPGEIRALADRAYEAWRTNLRHPSLQFKKTEGHESLYSVHVGLHFGPSRISKAICSSGRGSEATRNMTGFYPADCAALDSTRGDA
jgi:hypothetical protein